MRRRRAGFTMVELLIVIIIGGILIAMVTPRFGAIQAKRAVWNARDSFINLAVTARAVALERGTNVWLGFDQDNDSAWVEVSGGTIVGSVHFTSDFSADASLVRTPGILGVCYGPRGYADETCNVGTFPDTAVFTRGEETVRVSIRPLGQVERQ